MPRNKYRAIRTTVDNLPFSSKREAARYATLKILLYAGKISNLKTQPKFPIYINGIKVCDVLLDFEYDTKDGKVYEDSKGIDNPLSRLKRKMVQAAYGIKVKLV